MRKIEMVAYGAKVLMDVPDRLPGQPGHDWIPIAVNEDGAAIGCSVCMRAIIAKSSEDAEKLMETLDLTLACIPLEGRNGSANKHS